MTTIELDHGPNMGKVEEMASIFKKIRKKNIKNVKIELKGIFIQVWLA